MKRYIKSDATDDIIPKGQSDYFDRVENLFDLNDIDADFTITASGGEICYVRDDRVLFKNPRGNYSTLSKMEMYSNGDVYLHGTHENGGWYYKHVPLEDIWVYIPRQDRYINCIGEIRESFIESSRRPVKSGVENLDKIKEFEKRYAKIKGDVDKEEDLIQYYVGRYGIPEETLDEIAFNLRINSSRQIKSSRRPIKSSFVIEHWSPLLPQTQYVCDTDEGLGGTYNIDEALQFDTMMEAKQFIKEHDEEYGGKLKIHEFPIESSRKITSARYIATDPETGEVLGSADTYEEAVNEWGEDVTITDSEVGDEMDTTQGGILSSWDNDTPRGEGWLAHDDGKQKDECPYERGTVEYEDWIDGWEAAYQEVNGIGIGSSRKPINSSNAWNRGYNDYYNGKSNSDYPNDLSDEDIEEWMESWDYAKDEDKNDTDEIESNYQFNQRIVNSVLTKEITEDDAIKQIASRNNMNIGFAKRIFNNLMEDKSLIQSGVMEMADDINKDFDLNGDLYSWFDDYVNLDGKATTVGGELIRAANQILARFDNDGDKIGIGYGKETVNPAARYILAICNDYIDRNDIEEMLYNESRINYSDEEYEAWLQQFERTFTEYLRDHEELFHSPNKNDMWDYKEEEDDVDSSVSECCIYDNEDNEYWFQKDEDGWKCTNIEFGTQPEYEVDETFSSASDFEKMIYSKGEQKEPYGFFSENGLTYNWEGITDDDEGNYREWVITDVSVDGGLADVGDVWSADDFDGYGVYDANGREINVSDLY